MASFPISSASPFLPERRLSGLIATILVHAALILAWQFTRTLSVPAAQEGPTMQWIHLPPLAPDLKPAPVAAVPVPRPVQAAPARSASAALPHPAPAAPVPSARSVVPAPTAQEAAAQPVAPPEAPAKPDAAAILENARRSVGSIDRALRKESRPLIVAPPDSPELRMRQGMEQARALAPTRIWEAPKVEELVNNTGDGARRTRVITGRGTYCVTERSPATNVEMIEMHGKIRLTNCPAPEEPAKRQEWRTARD